MFLRSLIMSSQIPLKWFWLMIRYVFFAICVFLLVSCCVIKYFCLLVCIMFSLYFVFLLVQGDKIHATIRKQLIYMFQGKLVKGDCYKLCYFGVAPVSGSYRTTSHDYKHLFLMKTKVQKCEGSL